MSASFREKLESAQNLGIKDFAKVGIEKESLRVLDDGGLSQARHPVGLGSALTHPRITTDFSENLIELVTPPMSTSASALSYLDTLHDFVYRKLNDDERLWANSMPCLIADETNIPIAEYGSSNVGTMKRVYRKGLAVRYGKVMQTIAGIHFNVSYQHDLLANSLLHPQDGNANSEHSAEQGSQPLINNAYFSLIRNFHRHCWVLLYLFGASPAVCKSFLQGRQHSLDEFDSHTLYAPFGTSLRMSDLGYQNSAQGAIRIDCNDVSNYTRTLIDATQSSHPAYEKLGLLDDRGEHQQLNTNFLQIENEYYAVIRPKRVTQSGERPSSALLDRGVEYVEMRCIDLDPFEPAGIGEDTANFLVIFGLFCLYEDSPIISNDEQQECQINQQSIVNEGRRPDLKLQRNGQSISFTDWATEILDKSLNIAQSIDRVVGGNTYESAVKAQQGKVDDATTTPSSKVLEALRSNDENYYQFAMRQSNEIANSYRGRSNASAQGDLSQSALLNELAQMTEQSISDQLDIENSDTVSFQDYLKMYFN